MATAVATTVAPTTPEPGYTCQCGRRFRQKAPFARHMDVAHSSCESIKCTVCGKTFGTHNTLTMHMSVHDVKQQPFVRLQHVTDIKKAVTSVISGGVALTSSGGSGSGCNGSAGDAKMAAPPTVNGTATPAEKRAIIAEVRDGETSPDARSDGDDATTVRKSSRLRGKVPAWKAMFGESHSLDASETDGPTIRKRKGRLRSEEDDENEEDEVDEEKWDAAESTSSPAAAAAASAVARDHVVAVVAPTPRTTPTTAKRSRANKRTADAAFVCPTCAKEFTSDKYLTMHRALHEVVNPAENLMSDVYRQPDTSEAPQSSPRIRSPGGVAGGGGAGGGGGGANTSWTCKICRKTFAQNSNFKNHMRTHSDERPFVCSICSIGFKERWVAAAIISFLTITFFFFPLFPCGVGATSLSRSSAILSNYLLFTLCPFDLSLNINHFDLPVLRLSPFFSSMLSLSICPPHSLYVSCPSQSAPHYLVLPIAVCSTLPCPAHRSLLHTTLSCPSQSAPHYLVLPIAVCSTLPCPAHRSLLHTTLSCPSQSAPHYLVLPIAVCSTLPCPAHRSLLHTTFILCCFFSRISSLI